MWARVVDGAIVDVALDGRSIDGWVQVMAGDPRPDDTDEQTWISDLVLADGVVTQIWTPRPWATGELPEALRVRMAVGGTLRAVAQAALAANRTYLAISEPSAIAVTVQVRALTLQVQALIRLGLDQLDATD